MFFTDLEKVGEFRGISVYKTENKFLEFAGFFSSAILNVLGEEASPAILFHPKAEKILTEEEISSVLFHELGHILSGHLDSKNKNKNKNRLILNKQFEMEADAFATQYVKAGVLQSALKKIQDFRYKNGNWVTKLDVLSAKIIHYKRFKVLETMEKLGL